MKLVYGQKLDNCTVTDKCIKFAKARSNRIGVKLSYRVEKNTSSLSPYLRK
jgi:hypothetical protein